MIADSEIKLYVDMMIIESLLDNPLFIKEAGAGGAVASVLGSIKDYFESKIKTEGILNLIAPVGINALFTFLGAPWIGFLLALAQQAFNINVGNILSSIYNKIKELISGDKKITTQQVDSVVEGAVTSNYTPVSPGDEKHAEDVLNRIKSGSYGVKQQMRDVRMIKLATISYQEGVIEKNGALSFVFFKGLQTKIIPILIKFFGMIFKIALTSAGAIVVGSAIRSYIGTSDSKQTTYVSKQQKFKQNTSYQDTEYNSGNSFWIENFNNNPNGIINMLVTFAKEVYDGLDGLESLIKSSPSFQVVVNNIRQFNLTAEGASVVFLPKMFTSKKQIVDLFIDDVAKKAP